MGREVVTYRFADPLLDPAAFLVLALLHLDVAAGTKDSPCYFADRLGVCIRVDRETPSGEIRSGIRAG